jgi:SsrA-binding protein
MPAPGTKLIASNRKAYHDYAILDEIEAGIMLRGSEVKSLRDGHVQINEAFGRVVGNEMWLFGMTIPQYVNAHGFGAHVSERQRKLLMHRAEIDKLASRMGQEHLTLIPLSIYFKDGRVKIELGLAKGRTKGDKRQTMAKDDAAREIRDELGRRNKGRMSR